jgi:H+-translocating NAD(P) transhydrogenase subunit beta
MITNVASIQRLAYLGAALLFIFSLRGLSTQETARRGNANGILGMVIAVLVTTLALYSAPSGEHSSQAFAASLDAWGLLAGAIAIGATVGALLAARVAMTSMPELVAILHSFVGAAAVLVGIANYLERGAEETAVHSVEIVVGVFIGAVTFAGSVVAFGKLRGTIGSKPLLLPGRHAANLLMTLACVVLGGIFMNAAAPDALWALLVITGIACVLGAHLVMAIGGGDMPVVVSMLNSYSGWAAAAAGFMLSNDLLIVTGAMVGSSGAILSIIMCRAMNRSIVNVIFGGFGAAPPKAAGGAKEPAGPIHEATAQQVADLLAAARSVIIVPGYGMAVAQAQHPVKELTELLIKRGTKVRYAIHPVAGRLPGHMNVLLAEADVSYELVKEMDEINEDFGDTDVAVIIGANDIVNPSALTDTSSPIYGMPVLEVWKAAKVVMMKRSMNAGYAGVDNPLSYRENTLMLFGDAKATVTKLVHALQSASSEAAA